MKPTSSHFGSRMKDAARAVSPLVIEKITTTISMTKKAGMRMVDARSMPPFTPRPTMKTFAAMKQASRDRIYHFDRSGCSPCPIVSTKFWPDAAASMPEKPLNDWIRNATSQAEMTT